MIRLRQCPTSNDKLRLEAYNALESVMAQKPGFVRIIEDDTNWAAPHALAERFGRKFEQIVIVGMGGSSLGAQALRRALRYQYKTENWIFLDNVDPAFVQFRLMQVRDYQKTLWLLTSKTGNSVEVLALASIIDQQLKKNKIKWSEVGCVITEERSNPLFDWAQKESIPTIAVPLDVGGRFSVLTPVGLLPAALSGVSLHELREGAIWTLAQKDLVAELVCAARDSWSKEKWISVFWVYSEALKSFGSWLQQLWAESLAKKNDRQGNPSLRVSTPMVLSGVQDQHSVLQQIMEGARDKFIFLITESKANSNLNIETTPFSSISFLEKKSLAQLFSAEREATFETLKENGVEGLILEVDHAGPREMAALFLLFELVIATLGEMLGIDPYNQPGVEAGKKRTRDLIEK
jgi:glucose-6-phosphate isomerase